MGFGRIGRHLFRTVYRSRDLEVAAIAEIGEPEGHEYLLRFDTIMGRFPDEVSIREGNLYAVGRQVPFLIGEPGEVPSWSELGVDVVVEATSRPRTRAELERHLERGARRVILCAPPLEPPDITVLMGVNDGELSAGHRSVSNGSCTAHCAAPILKILHGAFGIERAFLNTVHAYTNQHRLADVPAKDPRRGRAAAQNIIPQDSNAATVIMGLMPELEGRLSGEAMSVPVPNGSVVDLVCWHTKKVTPLAVNEVVRTAAATAEWRDIVDYETEPIVSTDVSRSTYSATFDSRATMVLGERVSKTLSWYDNSWGYVHRVADLVRRLAELEREAA
jgi:glyceraldehyde 3-phosphate dehydrogenase